MEAYPEQPPGDGTRHRTAPNANAGVVTTAVRGQPAPARAETPMTDAEARFRAVHDGSPHGFALHRPVRADDGTVVDFTTPYINEAGVRIVGRTREEILGRPVLGVFPGTAENGVFSDYVRVLETGVPSHREIFYDHEELTAGLAVTAVRIGEGPGADIGVTFTDITERLRAESERENLLAALEAERATLRSIILQMPVPLALLVGPEHRFEVVNPAFRQVSGGGRDITGLTPREAFPELAGSGIFELFDRVYETGEPWESPETLIQYDRDGTGLRDTWFNLRYEPVRDAGGRVIAIFNFAVDVTEQVLARREVERLLEVERRARADTEMARERTARLQALTSALSAASTAQEVSDAVVRHATAAFDAVGAVVALLSPDGEWLEIVRALDLADDAGAEWRRFPVDAPAPLAESVRAKEPIYLESPAAWEARYPHLRPMLDASGHQANLVVPLILDGRALGVLGVAFSAPRAFDAEDRSLALAVAQQCAQTLERSRLFEAERAARAEAEQVRAEAEGANRAKSEFLAVMSHELRTPLNAIGGYAELLEMEIRGPVTPQQRADLHRIQSSQRHLLGLINEVLNYAKLETGTVHYEIAPVPVREALAESETLLATQARARGLEFVVAECPPDLCVRADAEKLRQILINLLGNAVKFTDRGGRVELACEWGEEAVHLTVRDTGIGIPADQLGRIFEPFVQVRADLTRTAEGTGLGLAISRDLARGMGGDLSVVSEPAVGSTFRVSLPRG